MHCLEYNEADFSVSDSTIVKCYLIYINKTFQIDF